MGRLAVQAVDEFELLPVEAVLGIADLAHGLANGLFHFLGNARRPLAILVDPLAANFAGQDHELGGGQRLAGDPRFGIDAEEQIDDGVGNLVGNLVGVTFGNAFRGEEIVAAHE